MREPLEFSNSLTQPGNSSQHVDLEQKLRDAEAIIDSLAGSAIDYILLLDLDGRIAYANRIVPGLTVEQVVGKPIEQFLAGKHRSNVKECICRVIETQQPGQVEVEFSPPGGGVMCFEANVAPVIQNHKVVSLSLTARDVTARVQAERKLRESEERFRSIFENEPECVKLVDAGGRLLDMNPAGLAMIEVDSIESVRGVKILKVIAPAYRKMFAKASLETLYGQRRDIQFEIIGMRGTRRWMDSHMVPIASGSRGNVLLAVTRDMTAQRNATEQRRQLREQLRHVARLSTLGEMVAGIAHEVNQPLYAIANFATACTKTLESGGSQEAERALAWTRKISEQAERVHGIISRLKNFARKAETERSLVDVNDLVRESVNLVDFEARRLHVSVRCSLTDSPPRVMADRIQLQQVLVNLLRNAFDAVERIAEGKRRVTLQTICNQNQVEVVCRDNGSGFPADDALRIFDAFYTTKPKGMGMGLSICRSIVEAHAGKISASTGREGTTFVVTLPREEWDVCAA